MPRVAIDGSGLGRLQACEPDAHRDGRLEGWRCLESIHRERFIGREPLVGGIAPPEFGALSLGELHVGVGKDRHEVALKGRIGAGQRRHDPVAEAEQVVAGVDRRRDAPLHVHRRLPIPHLVVVFDIVMDERRLVEDLDRHGSRLHRFARRRGQLWPVGPHGVIGGQRDEWPQELPATGEEIARHRGRRSERLECLANRGRPAKSPGQ